MTTRADYRHHYTLAFEALAKRIRTDRAGELEKLEGQARESAERAARHESELFSAEELTAEQLHRDLVDAEKALQGYERAFGAGFARLFNVLWSSEDPARPDLDADYSVEELWTMALAQLDGFMVDALKTTAAKQAEIEALERQVRELDPPARNASLKAYEDRALVAEARVRELEQGGEQLEAERAWVGSGPNARILWDLIDQLSCHLWSTSQPGQDGRPDTHAQPSEACCAVIVARVAELVHVVGEIGDLGEQLNQERSRHADERDELVVERDAWKAQAAASELEVRRLTDLLEAKPGHEPTVSANELTDVELAHTISAWCDGTKPLCGYLHRASTRLEELHAEVLAHEDADAQRQGKTGDFLADPATLSEVP